MKPIAILGAGPAGLLAAHACSMAERPFAIFSHPQKSRLGGAQFLHTPIPGLTSDEPDAMLTYHTMGNADYYRHKVYGSNPHVPFVSMAFVEDGQQVPAWSLRDLYERLWLTFNHGINPTSIDHNWLKEHGADFEAVIVAMPRDRICGPWANHQFQSHQVKILNEAISPGVMDNTIHYDGTPDRSWYRQSLIFGTGSTEWGTQVNPPIAGLVTVTKPLRTNCDCWPEAIRVGRYGRWEKGVLAHDGYKRVAEYLGG